MPWFHELLTSISRSHTRSPPRLTIRVISVALSAVLVLGTVAPGLAFAAEADSEQEGSAPPGALPGLEESPELEASGEEAVLEELPVATSGGEERAPLESEPPQESEPPPPPPEAPAATAEIPPASEPPLGPTYSPASEPETQVVPSVPVENEPLPAPESPRPASQGQPEAQAEQAAPEAPPPVSPPEAPELTAAPPPAVPAQRSDATGSLVGRRAHTVQAGECLWSIAEALLPAGASNTEIAAEVQRLWRLNATRIGTGDPDRLYVGTKLRLR